MIKLLQLAFEGLLIGGILLMIYSQLVRPLVRKTPVFPMFRRHKNLERKIEGVNEKLEEKNLERDLQGKKKKLSN